jgi:hypothetical protein
MTLAVVTSVVVFEKKTGDDGGSEVRNTSYETHGQKNYNQPSPPQATFEKQQN